MDQTFTKDERLCKKILIAKLFRDGHSFFIHPFRVTFLETEIPVSYPVQLLISVPKQIHRHAVDRNTLKRRIRESYRKNKGILYGPLGEKESQMALCITYTAKEILPSDLIREKIILLLLRLGKGHGKTSG